MANKYGDKLKKDFLDALKDEKISLEEAFNLAIDLCTMINAFIQAAKCNKKVEEKPESAEERGENQDGKSS